MVTSSYGWSGHLSDSKSDGFTFSRNEDDLGTNLDVTFVA